jgi:hypothetical protein
MASKRKQTVKKNRHQLRRNRGAQGKGTSKYAEKVRSGNMKYSLICNRYVC